MDMGLKTKFKYNIQQNKMCLHLNLKGKKILHEKE